MPDSTGLASTGATFEFLQSQASQSRRVRPPGPDAGDGVDRVPLRAEPDRLNRRESRLGLRSLFGRHKSTTDSDRAPTLAAAPPKESSQRAGGIRASLAGIGNWPYGLHNGSNNSRRSESVLPSFTLSAENDAQSRSPPTAASNLKHKKSASVVRGMRGCLAAWDPPPLFKAYPQAIQHAHLPACTSSAEAVLRQHHSKAGMSLMDGLNQSLLALGVTDESTGEKTDKARKRHRRNASVSSLKLEWTSKIFILVTSGYLLQYAGEGSFDRLPERALQLGKDSAAFASDVIPGRHWVLQVSSAADFEGTTTSPTSPFFARLPFRSHERRQASDFLMVFDSAEEMDGWIATLRREIEALGGKQNLSETGKPKVGDEVQRLKNQISQRTLVVRDPDRFPRVISPDMDWNSVPSMTSPDIHLELADSDGALDRSFDDTSTASGISHDGRQLDGLRDSTHRLSYISSGQRTVVTSAGSSPMSSPVRDSFASYQDDCSVPDLQPLDDQTQPRLRPNAAAINDRRQSLQMMNHLMEMRLASAQNSSRPHSSYSSSWHPDLAPHVVSAPQTTPNFSVPQGVSKRYSLARSAASGFSEPAPAPFSFPPMASRSSSRRPPPTTLSINSRPLSFVEDQPSPLSPSSSQFDVGTAPDTPSMFSPWAEQADNEESMDRSSKFSVSSSRPALKEHCVQEDEQHRSHHHVNEESLRALTQNIEGRRGSHPGFLTPDQRSDHPAIPRPRAKSSLGDFGRSRSPESASTQRTLRTRRLSLYALTAEQPLFNPYDLPLRARTPSLKPAPQRSSQHLRKDSFSKSLLQRRSMSHLAEGPPPAPPPNRALPPIPPRKLSAAKSATGKQQ
ncbi:hypothetical protein B0H66DRAFT_244367 [Apodospora peruviana]|uniref:PH domain-containing protein n=1 Tax=Apodospora peruviana TaxID=516989 RepID=A0AAE0M4C3_9PEZI|nr:hypothetical protein B0H66DRAFT_244367 [Apodospora peruviana]